MVLEGKLLAFLAFLLAGRNAAAEQPQPRRAVPPGPLPNAGPSVAPGAPIAPPWPIAPPADLPVFPGPGWEYDAPPSAAVMQRATALLDALWSHGVGAFQTEYTAGHWVTYLAEIVAGGKKGVTAWRVRTSPAPSVFVPPAPPPPPAPAPELPIIPSTVVVPVHPAADGMDPRDVQDALNHLGYGPLAVDGIIGPQTKAAIKKFQAANPPLAVDGIVGPQTKSVLQAKLSALHGSSVVLPPTPLDIPVQTTKDVQHALNALGYGPVTEDGIIGPKTGAVVRNFQGDHPPLVVDGVPGPQTKAALAAALQAGRFFEPSEAST